MAGQITITIEETFRIESFSFHKTEVIYNCHPSRSPPSGNDATPKTSERYSHQTSSPTVQDERPLRLIGRGADGAKVFEIPDTARAVKISSDSSTLAAEFAKQTRVNKFMRDINQSAVFRMDCHEFTTLLPRVPVAFAEHNDSDSKFWNNMGPRLSRPGARVYGHQVKKFPSKPGTAAMVVERIPPLPAPISQMLIRKYFDEDEIAVAYENEDNKDCLIQLQFGVEPVQYEMDSDFEGSDRGEEDPIFSQGNGDESDDEVDDDDDDATICNDTDDADDSESTTISVDIDNESFFSYDEDEDDFDPSIHTTRDFPGTLPQLLDNIPMCLPGLVKTIGTGYAILHFGLFMDGLGTEFVLGGGHQRLKVWMLDFDQCSSLPFSKPVYHIDGSGKRTTATELAMAIKERILPVLIDGGFMPLPKPYLDEGDTEGKAAHKLWEDFKHAYITVGEYCVRRENREELAGAPLQVCLAVEEAMEARANSPVDDILFVEDNEDEENDGLEEDKQADEDDEATISPKTKATSNTTAQTEVTISSTNSIISTAVLTTKYSSINSIWVGGYSVSNKGIDTSIATDYFSGHTQFVALQEMLEAVEDLEMDQEWLAGQEDEEELIRTLPRKSV